jgi:hypothetical protein
MCCESHYNVWRSRLLMADLVTATLALCINVVTKNLWPVLTTQTNESSEILIFRQDNEDINIRMLMVKHVIRNAYCVLVPMMIYWLIDWLIDWLNWLNQTPTQRVYILCRVLMALGIVCGQLILRGCISSWGVLGLSPLINCLITHVPCENYVEC